MKKRCLFSSPAPRIPVILLVFLLLFTVCSRQAQKTPADTISLFVTGDALISQPWSQYDEPEFVQLIERVRGADAAITNLEMLLHTYKGYAQANSGGTYMAAEPAIARELAWAGFDMVGNANNHTFDYGSTGVLETIENVEGAGIVIAGAGKDLQRARAPVYFESAAGTVALLSTSSTFTAYGRASRSRPDLHGRPGLNPLTVERQYTIDLPSAQKLRETAQSLGLPVGQPRNGRFSMFGRNFTIGEAYSQSYVIDPKDLEGNLAAVREARENADWVVMSMHAHQSARNNMPPEFLIQFAHACIDNGADVFFTHGPHYIKGIEIYKGKPVFYSLGNFVFQNETIAHLPVEFYDQYGLGDDATPDDAFDARTTTDRGVDTRGFPASRRYWESVAAEVDFSNGELNVIRLIPITLGFGKPRGVRGRPLLADAELGKYLIDQMIERSAPFGTEITYDEAKNIGVITVQ